MNTAGMSLCKYWNNYYYYEDKVDFNELKKFNEEQIESCKKIIETEIEYRIWNLNLFRFLVNIDIEKNIIILRVSDKFDDNDMIYKDYLNKFEKILNNDILNKIIEIAIDDTKKFYS